MEKLQVIGLSGKIGTGKDFIAKEYFYPMGFKPWSLALHFKVWIVGKGEATAEEVFKTKPPKIRDLLQKTGTEEGRNVYGQDVWVNTMFAWMNTLNELWNQNKYIITDIRFPNEVEAVQKNGGKVYRIVAPLREKNSPASPEARLHISETALDNYSLDKFDGIILNDPAQSSTLDSQINVLMGTETYYDYERYVDVFDSVFGPEFYAVFKKMDIAFDKFDEILKKRKSK